jgi:hypothetical protein
MPLGRSGIAAHLRLDVDRRALLRPTRIGVTFELPLELADVMSSRPAIDATAARAGSTVAAIAAGSRPAGR